jgi:hypothetical protein
MRTSSPASPASKCCSSKAVVFKKLVSMNEWSAMRYSEIARSLPMICIIAVCYKPRQWLSSHWFVSRPACRPFNSVSDAELFVKTGLLFSKEFKHLLWYFGRKFWFAENAFYSVPVGSNKLIWYGINHGAVVWGSRKVDSLTDGFRAWATFPTLMAFATLFYSIHKPGFKLSLWKIVWLHALRNENDAVTHLLKPAIPHRAITRLRHPCTYARCVWKPTLNSSPYEKLLCFKLYCLVLHK